MAAGLGFKTFTTGEVLTAADTNGYLMQGVLVFASSAARAAAITSPQEGQYSYLKDTNSTEYYDGAAWIAAPIGDITGVTAGTGISGGGTSGTVTVTNSMATEITAAGDIIVGTGSGTFDNLPIGTTAQVLTADTTVSPYKVKWATPTSGALTLLSTSSFSAVSSVSLASSTFTSTYTNYKIIFNLTAASAILTVSTRMRASGTDNTTANYYQMSTGMTSTSATSNVGENGTTSWTIEPSAASPIWVLDFDLLNPNTSTRTQMVGFLVCDNNVNFIGRSVRALFNANTSFDAMSFIASTGNFTGSVSVYGYSK
jgi:hypothetical protein